MRVLFTTTPVVGHFHPLVPIARTLESAHHAVAFASTPNFASTVEASGFSFFPIGLGVQELFATPEMQEYARLTDAIARRELMRRRIAPGLVPRLWIPDMMALCDSWVPDVIVAENFEFAGRVAAERRDIPHAALKVGDAYGYAERHELVPAMDEHRRSVGLPPDPRWVHALPLSVPAQ
jgi:UDP:flavonoid glycosyltransferase YjiC (YdhE family)